jgi:hypothetical protein
MIELAVQASEAAAAVEEGRSAFLARDLETAHAAFARAYRRDARDPRVLSWYGVTLVLVERNSNLGAQLCEQSLRAGGPDPERLLNLARIHLALGQRERVVQTVARGLERWPDDPGLLAARAALGGRRKPPLPFLSREHPWNRALGRLRHRLRGATPEYELSPVALGTPSPPAEPGSRS